MRAADPESPIETPFPESRSAVPDVRLVPVARGRRRPRSSGRARGGATTVAEVSPLVILEAVASTAMVATAVACFVAVASTASAPLLAASLLLGRVARSPGED